MTIANGHHDGRLGRVACGYLPRLLLEGLTWEFLMSFRETVFEFQEIVIFQLGRLVLKVSVSWTSADLAMIRTRKERFGERAVIWRVERGWTRRQDESRQDRHRRVHLVD